MAALPQEGDMAGQDAKAPRYLEFGRELVPGFEPAPRYEVDDLVCHQRGYGRRLQDGRNDSAFSLQEEPS